MRLATIFNGRVMAALIIFSAACKKDAVTGNDKGILQPAVEKLSRDYIQAGEKLTVYGKNLSQGNWQTEVTISGREAEILVKTGDSIQVLVPPKVSTGKILVTVSFGDQFKVAFGPSIEVKPTPLIRSFWPLYAYGGAEIILNVENFSRDNTDNSITLNGQPLAITGGNGHDTILVRLPADAQTGVLHWNTFSGPVLQMDSSFPVRQAGYPVATVGEWLHADPAFSFTDTLLRGYPQLAGTNYDLYAGIYNTALSYINDPSRTYTIFLPADEAYYNRGISLNKFIDNIKDKPYVYHSPLVAAIIPDVQLSLNAVHGGDEYNTLYTEQLVYYPLGSPDHILKMQVSEVNGDKYVNLLGIWGETNPPVKILREHRIGNATIMETDGETGIIYF